MHRLILTFGTLYWSNECRCSVHENIAATDSKERAPRQLPPSKQQEELISWTLLLWHLSKWEEDKRKPAMLSESRRK